MTQKIHEAQRVSTTHPRASQAARRRSASLGPSFAIVVAGALLTFGFLATARPNMKIKGQDVAVAAVGVAVIVVFVAAVAFQWSDGDDHGDEEGDHGGDRSDGDDSTTRGRSSTDRPQHGNDHERPHEVELLLDRQRPHVPQRRGRRELIPVVGAGRELPPV